MTIALLNGYIIILVIIFIIILVIFGFAFVRARHAGKRTSASVTPIPDTAHRNEYTRVDPNDTDEVRQSDPHTDIAQRQTSSHDVETK